MNPYNLHFFIVNDGLAAELVQVNIWFVTFDQRSKVGQLGLVCERRKVGRNWFFLEIITVCIYSLKDYFIFEKAFMFTFKLVSPSRLAVVMWHSLVSVWQSRSKRSQGNDWSPFTSTISPTWMSRHFFSSNLPFRSMRVGELLISRSDLCRKKSS